MADRVRSDHPSIATVRARADETPTGRLVAVPAAEADRVPPDEVVRVVLGGNERFARFESTPGDDRLVVRGVYDAPRFARDPGSGTDRLAAWLADVPAGNSVLVDAISPGFLYGLRRPGESVVYDASEPPADSLAAIARDLDG